MDIYFYIILTLTLGANIIFAVLWYAERKRRIKDAIKREESEGLFKAVFEQTGGYRMILEPTEDGIPTVYDANQAACASHGYTREEMLGRPVADLDDEEGQRLCRERTRGILSGKTLSVENRHVRKDGSSFPVEVFADVVKFKDKPPLIVSTELDISERNKASEALRKSEAYYRLLFESSIDAVFVADVKTGQILDANYQAELLLGWNRNELLKMNQASLHPNPIKYQEIFNEHLSLATEFPAMRSAEVLHKDGTIIPVEINAGVVELDGHTVAIGSFHDIRGRLHNEEALRQERQRLEYIIEGSRLGTWVWNIEKNTAVFNEMWATILGYTMDEIGPSSYELWKSLGHPDDVPRIESLLNRCATGEMLDYNSEFRMRHKDGHWAWILDRGRVMTHDAEGRPLEMFGTHTDITEHKLVELEKDRFMAAIDQAAETIMITDIRGIIEYVNPAFETVTGYSRKEAIWHNPSMLKSGEQGVEFYKEMWGTLLRGETWTGRFINKKKDGTLYTEDAKISVVKDSTGKFVNYVGVKRDITEEIKLESQLRQAQKMDAVGRLAGGVAHDFNNMLGVILGHTEMILEEMKPDMPFYEDLTEIRKAGKRSAELTKQLLGFARKQTVAPKVIDLNKTISDMVNMLKRMIGEDIELRWISGSDLWSVKVDPSQIDQILVNLCVNARDAIGNVGNITIETSNIVFDSSYCETHVEFIPGDYVLLAVSDNGCGMNSETLDSVFEPFFTTKGLGKGTGLGLAMVYGVVRQNNGIINIYSELDHGTTFKIYLPRHMDKSEPSIVKKPEAPLERGHETILLVEDEPGILKMTTRMLESYGYTVWATGNSEEAIDLANTNGDSIDLIMTDVIMPKMNGYDLTKKISSRCPDVKCLFMSGYTSNVIADHGVLEEGVNFIQKPFSKKNLAIKVREVLGEL
jgi:PAS domain S-box-containing protein